jgi:thiol-disulfide isomerase/thioredoxin
MEFLVSIVALIGAMSVLNLLLTMAVIRRLKQKPSDPIEPDLPELPAGSKLPVFRGESVSGAVVASADLAGSGSLFAFFDTGCSVCKPTVPKLVEYARDNGLKADQVIAVIGGDRVAATEYVEELDGAATVIVEETLGPVASAFSITGIPAFVEVDSTGTVVRSGTARSVLTARV